MITFDQRGTGEAEPSLRVDARFGLPSSASVESPEARRALAEAATRIRAEIESRGIDLGAYNTEESANDIEALRRALGVEKVVLVAHSYGTHLALAYIKRFGSNVERAVLGVVNGLDDRWRDPLEGDRWLERVAERIREDQAPGASYDLIGHVGRVLRQYEQEPALVPLDGQNVLVGKEELRLLTTLRAGDIGFVQDMPVLFTALERRSNLEQIAAAVQQILRQRPIGAAMTYAMHVASGVSREKRQRIEANVADAMFGNAINWGIGDDAFVRAFGVPDLGPSFRARFASDVPVLLISGTLDGRTSEADARSVGSQFGDPAYITLDGASHDFFFHESTASVLWEPLGAFMRGELVASQEIRVPTEFRGVPGQGR